MTKKPDQRPHNVIRTRTPAYFFGSGKAAATNPNAKKRQPSKLPTTLDELKQRFDDLVYKEGTGGDTGLARTFERWKL